MKHLLQIDPLIKARHSDLVEKPVVVVVNDFDEDEAKRFTAAFSKAHNTGQTVIPVIIDSYGGDAYSVLSMVGDIEQSDLPVATIAKGKAMSAGALLLACGTQDYRYCDRNASIMIHEVSVETDGRNTDVQATAKETDRLNKQLLKMIAEKCKQSKDYFIELIKHNGNVDWYLTPQDAKKHKIIDHIGVPTMVTEVTVSMRFE